MTVLKSSKKHFEPSTTCKDHIYILVFHKEHKNADHMELNGDRVSAPELERHTGSKLVWIQLYFHHLGMKIL